MHIPDLPEKPFRYLEKYSALTLQKYEKEIEEILEKVDVYTNVFIYRKLRFIYQNIDNSLTHEDLKTELLYQGIKNVFTVYPVIDNRLHALNICKRAVQNHGLNLISRMTCLKRVNTIQLEDGSRIFQYPVSFDEKYALGNEKPAPEKQSLLNTGKYIPDHSTNVLDTLFWRKMLRKIQRKKEDLFVLSSWHIQ